MLPVWERLGSGGVVWVSGSGRGVWSLQAACGSLPGRCAAGPPSSSSKRQQKVKMGWDVTRKWSKSGPLRCAALSSTHSPIRRSSSARPPESKSRPAACRVQQGSQPQGSPRGPPTRSQPATAAKQQRAIGAAGGESGNKVEGARPSWGRTSGGPCKGSARGRPGQAREGQGWAPPIASSPPSPSSSKGRRQQGARAPRYWSRFGRGTVDFSFGSQFQTRCRAARQNPCRCNNSIRMPPPGKSLVLCSPAGPAILPSNVLLLTEQGQQGLALLSSFRRSPSWSVAKSLNLQCHLVGQPASQIPAPTLKCSGTVFVHAADHPQRNGGSSHHPAGHWSRIAACAPGRSCTRTPVRTASHITEHALSIEERGDMG